MLLRIFAGWINRRQIEVIEYLTAENRILKKRLGKRCIRFSDSERWRAKHILWVARRFVSSKPLSHRIPCCMGIGS